NSDVQKIHWGAGPGRRAELTHYAWAPAFTGAKRLKRPIQTATKSDIPTTINREQSQSISDAGTKHIASRTGNGG
ncbi:Hypothetical predicted protein, partial [Pelobates cultripes]